MRRLVLLALLIVPTLAHAESIGRLHAKDAAALVKTSVTVRGVVTACYTTERVSKLFVQDATGGVCVYGSPRTCAAIGDSIEVTGTVTVYSGLTEVAGRADSPLAVKALGRATAAPKAEARTIAQVLGVLQADGSEPDEGRLVQVRDVTIRMADGSVPAAGTRFKDDTSYRLVGADAAADAPYVIMRVADAEGCEGMPSLDGAAIPSGVVHVTGVISQFANRETGKGGYQLMPRIPADLAPAGK